MPYNPNDPNSDPNNPEGAVLVTTYNDPILNVEELVRHCHPQSVLRNQGPESLQTVEKLGKIWNDYRERVISKEEAGSQIDALLKGDIATYITDPLTLESVKKTIDAINKVTL